MAEEDISGKPVAGSPEPVAIQDSNTTSEVPMPAEEQATAPIDSAQGEPEVAASEPITETPPAEAQPIDEAQGKTAQPQEQTAQRPAVEPFVQENFQSEESFNYAQDKTPSEVKESPRVEETSPAPAEPEPVQNEPPVEQAGSTGQALEVPPVQMGTAHAEQQTAQRRADEPMGLTSASVDEPFAPEPEETPPHSEESPRVAEPVSQATESPRISREVLKELSLKGHSETQLRKRNKLDKILSLLGKKETVTNDEVEKLLHVSDATATRYLSLLKKEGKVRQVGKTGRGVAYEKISL